MPESAAQWAGSPCSDTVLSHAPDAAHVFIPMSMGKRIGTLGNAKILPSPPGLPATKLQGSYSHFPLASLHYFFYSEPASTQ